MAYIQQDDIADRKLVDYVPETTSKVSFIDCFKYKQTWAFAFGKFMTDGVWWFFLILDSCLFKISLWNGFYSKCIPLFVLYMITLLSIIGGWLPTLFR